MSFEQLKQALPGPSTMGLLLGIIILLSGTLYFARLLPLERTYNDFRIEIESTCKKVSPQERGVCLHVEALEWAMYDRTMFFKISANAWDNLRAAIIFVVVVSGVVTSIYIANSTGKAQGDVSSILKSAGAAAAFLTPTLLGLYGAFNMSNKPEELRSTAMLLADLNNAFLMNRCRPPADANQVHPPASTKYCALTTDEQEMFQKFNRYAFAGFNVLGKVNESQLNKGSDVASSPGKRTSSP